MHNISFWSRTSINYSIPSNGTLSPVVFVLFYYEDNAVNNHDNSSFLKHNREISMDAERIAHPIHIPFTSRKKEVTLAFKPQNLCLSHLQLYGL